MGSGFGIFFGGGGGSLRSDNFKMREISVSYPVGPGELTEVTDLWI